MVTRSTTGRGGAKVPGEPKGPLQEVTDIPLRHPKGGRPPERGAVREATEVSIKAATDTGRLTDEDAAAVAAIRALADKIDAWDDIVQWAIEDAGAEGRPKVPANDNVTLPTFLKFCDALGLTPAGRDRLADKKESSGGSKLGKLRSAHGGPTA